MADSTRSPSPPAMPVTPGGPGGRLGQLGERDRGAQVCVRFPADFGRAAEVEDEAGDGDADEGEFDVGGEVPVRRVCEHKLSFCRLGMRKEGVVCDLP